MPHVIRACLAFAATLVAASAAAAATSPWAETTGARLRLVAPGGRPAADGTLTAGIEIALEDGWKTYWRHPGDAGIAPEFDFSASTNLAGAAVRFPAPHRFEDGGATSAGYEGTVVLPVALTPAVAALPVMVAVTVHFGLCRELCVPATATARVMVSAATVPDAAAAALVAEAEAAVPGGPGEAGLAVTAVAADPAAAGAVVVTARLAEPDAPADLFAEGPGDAFPPLPAFLGRDGATARWRVVLDRNRPAPAGALIRLTLVNGAAAVEEERPLP